MCIFYDQKQRKDVKRMARGGLSFDGIGAQYATYQADGSVSAVALASQAVAGYGVEGKVVALAGNGVAGYGSAGDPVLGKIDKYELDGYMTVQYAGYTEVPGVSGKLPTAGGFVCVDGAGAVSKSASGIAGPARAASVDNTANVNTVVVLLG